MTPITWTRRNWPPRYGAIYDATGGAAASCSRLSFGWQARGTVRVGLDGFRLVSVGGHKSAIAAMRAFDVVALSSAQPIKQEKSS